MEQKNFASVEATYIKGFNALSCLFYEEFCQNLKSNQKKTEREQNICLLALEILSKLEEKQGSLCFRLSEIRSDLPESFGAFCDLPNFISILQQSGFYFFTGLAKNTSGNASEDAPINTSKNASYFWVWREEELCFSLGRFAALHLKLWEHLEQRIAVEQGNAFWNEELLLSALEGLKGRKLPQPPELLQKCLQKLCSNRLLLIVGGPGSGKTTLLASLLHILKEAEQRWAGQRLEFALSAPTARAAQRMLESLNQIVSIEGIVAQTLHKLLSIGWSRTQFYRAISPGKLPSKLGLARNLLKLDLLIIDEVSMLDSEMALQLLASMRPNTRLVLIGDPQQLPALGLGRFWQDLLVGVGKDCPAMIELEGSYRSTEKITALAKDILEGNQEAFLEKICAPPQEASAAISRYSAANNAHSWQQYLQEHWCLNLRTSVSSFGESDKIEPFFHWMQKYSILTPLQKGPWGAQHINQVLAQKYSNTPFCTFFHGCPLQITRNNYQLGLYNGDRGVCLHIGSQLYGVFAGSPYRFFAMSDLADCEPSFVQSIHKSQGSEYENVCLLLPEPMKQNPEPNTVWSRSLLYTAVTRAKSKLCFLGTELGLQSAAEALKTEDSKEATSLLTLLLRGFFKKNSEFPE